VKAARTAVAIAAACFLGASCPARAAVGSQSNRPPVAPENPWAYSITVDGYFSPDQSAYATPIVTADRSWLHLEGRYNYEDLDTGSLWVGYNFAAGKNVVLDVTPMVGGSFGRTNGIGPGLEASLTYKKIALSVSNEYVYNPVYKTENFYYSWLQLTYSPSKWLNFGALTQHTKAFGSSADEQPGLFAGVSHKQCQFTLYVFSARLNDPTAILEAGVNF
jgi:hypothetical protein